MTDPHPGTAAFRAARDLLLATREDYEAARRQFAWPDLTEFNFALDWFDVIAARARPADALRIVGERRRRAGSATPSCPPLRPRWPTSCAARACSAATALLLMLGNEVAALGGDAGGDEARRRGDPGLDAAQPERPRRPAARGRRAVRRHRRGRRRKFARLPARRLDAGSPSADAAAGLARLPPTPRRAGAFTPDGADPRRRSAAALLHLGHHRAAQARAAHATCATRSGHLSTMYWLGPAARRRAPEHLLAGLGQARLELRLRALDRRGDGADPRTRRASTPAALCDAIGATASPRFCAPPTVWRMLIQEDLAPRPTGAARAASAPASRSTPR